MSLTSIFFLVVAVTCLIMIFILRSLIKSLDRTQKELEKAQVEIVTKNNELEVIKDVQSEIKKSKGRKAPQKVETAAEGDSASRIDRLNRVSDGDGS